MTTIYIPTAGRVQKQHTWRFISPGWRQRTVLVAPPGDAARLDLLGYPVLACPAKGIGDTRQWILDQHDVAEHGPTLVMADDDLRFARRRLDDPTKFLPMDSPEQFDALMAQLEYMMHQVAFGGLANRGGAHLHTGRYRVNGRIHDFQVFNVPVARAEGVRANRVRFMEDFDVALQFLTKGYPTALLNTFAKDDIGGSNAPGGCSSYRDGAGQAEAAAELHRLFPDFVTPVIKKGWQGDMAGTRTDVRVQWKKAFEAGCARRELLGRPQEVLPV